MTHKMPGTVEFEKIQHMIQLRDVSTLKEVFCGPKGLAEVLGSDINTGIEPNTVGWRLQHFGSNQLPKREPMTLLDTLKEAADDAMVQILAVVGVASIILGLTVPNFNTGQKDPSEWIEGIAILMAVAIIIIIGAINNYQKAKKFEEIEGQADKKTVCVIRAGHVVSLQSTELVVGDLVVVENGSDLTCDMILVDGTDIGMNEASITGESDLARKTVEGDPFLVSGTTVEEGYGKGLVVAVGISSCKGLVHSSLNDQEETQTPLQEKLTELGKKIGNFGLALAFILLISLCVKEIFLITALGKTAHPAVFLGFIVVAVSMVAVAIPEGLPLAVTISLAYSMKSMMKEQCLVRVLASCETMGAATTICSDKTGTLTTGEMTVVQGLFCENEFCVDGFGVTKHSNSAATVDGGLRLSHVLGAEISQELVVSLSLNTTARVNDDGIWMGSGTETALCRFVESLRIKPESIRSLTSSSRQYAFNSEKKHMVTLIRSPDRVKGLLKGASEIILGVCTHYKDAAGTLHLLTDAKRAYFNDFITHMAGQGNRTIGFAVSTDGALMNGDEYPEQSPVSNIYNYVWLGVLGIQDPIRREVIPAVEICKRAHISVRMITGDSLQTALRISELIGLMSSPHDCAITGSELRRLYNEDRDTLIAKLPSIKVLARSSPGDKYLMVKLLQDAGHVVGVTGDGTNDAPALKVADVGLAMNTGTDVAKKASDIVLLDNNFASIVTAIRWGRTVNENIMKFIQYQLSINVAAVGITFIGSLASSVSKEAIAPVQLLWVNLIMDTLAALSLATEQPDDACLTRCPRKKREFIVSRRMLTFILCHGLYQLGVLTALFFFGHEWLHTVDAYSDGCADTQILVSNSTHEEWCRGMCKEGGGLITNPALDCHQGRVHTTVLFNVFVWFQIFNVLNARKIFDEINCFDGLWSRSRPLVLIFTTIIVLQIACVELMGDLTKTTGLSMYHWAFCVLMGSTELLVGFCVRRVRISEPCLKPMEEIFPPKVLVSTKNLEDDHTLLLNDYLAE